MTEMLPSLPVRSSYSVTDRVEIPKLRVNHAIGDSVVCETDNSVPLVVCRGCCGSFQDGGSAIPSEDGIIAFDVLDRVDLHPLENPQLAFQVRRARQ